MPAPAAEARAVVGGAAPPLGAVSDNIQLPVTSCHLATSAGRSFRTCAQSGAQTVRPSIILMTVAKLASVGLTSLRTGMPNAIELKVDCAGEESRKSMSFLPASPCGAPFTRLT